MSYSYARNFRTRLTAEKEIAALPDTTLPPLVKDLIITTLRQMSPDTDNTFIRVTATGHWHHDIKVTQEYF